MTEVNYTPGPWRADVTPPEKDYPHPYLRLYGGDGIGDEEGNGGFHLSGIVSNADARLIAAAPDLFEALQSVRKLISEAAMTGFNCKDGDWAERLFKSQQQTSKAIDAATGGGPKPIAFNS